MARAKERLEVENRASETGHSPSIRRGNQGDDRGDPFRKDWPHSNMRNLQ